MRIAFWLLQDSVREWRRWVAGLYYIRHCIGALAVLPPGEAPEAVAFVPRSLDHDLVDPELSGRTKWLKTVRVADEWLASARRDDLAALLEKHSCDVTFPLLGMPPVAPPGRVIGWITDYQHKHYPALFSQQEVNYRDNLYRFLIGVCDRIVSSSETVRGDLLRFYDGIGGRDRVLRFTARPPDAAFARDPRAALDRLNVPSEYVYLPNQFWVHKNHRVAFEAWRKLKSQGYRYSLVCTGATEDYRSPGHYQELVDFLAKHNLGDTVQLLGFVERDQQWQLYRGAKIVLQPSLFEGWSTSVEEAKSLDKALVLSDIPCHREQMGGAGRYFAPDDPDELAQRVIEAWSDVAQGYEPGREPQIRERSLGRMQDFGHALQGLFAKTAASPASGRAALVLPLLLHVQSECEARLKVIDQLSQAADERLALIHEVTAAAQQRLAVINTLDRACRDRAAKILQLERLLEKV